MRIFESILPILFLAAAVLGGVFLLWPKYQNVADMQQAIQAHEERIERGETLLAQLREQKRQAEERQEDFAKLSRAVPEDEALPGLYHDVQRLVAESGLVLSSIGSDPQLIQEGGGALQGTTISLQLEGSWQGIKRFLEQTLVFQRMLNAQSISLSVQDQDTETLLLSTEITSYSVPEQE